MLDGPGKERLQRNAVAAHEQLSLRVVQPQTVEYAVKLL
jgi:hypothetical protein